ncbi:MAG TPA: nucleotidyltransferase domain-containing protein [Cryomorphaceae bacterium]|nr:nucleotidyltransferase domain-containing protein [Cryomorphaceae bacterium]
MIDLLNDKKEELNSICRKNQVAELYLFGSAASNHFNEESDLDFSVLFDSNLPPLEHGEAFFNLKHDLETLFSKSVDLISYRVVKNPVFKEELDRTKVMLYAAQSSLEIST